MNKTYNTKAHAKVNLFLKVCGLYPNGYHRLYMLMQEISLGDDVRITISDEKDFDIKLVCDKIDIEVKKNLCYKAADAFYRNYYVLLKEQGVEEPEKTFGYTEIEVNKVVPSEAGLAGGSSDGATVLKVLQEHYGNPFKIDDLITMAAGIGADVPFFLYGHSAICEGIGEIITPIPSLAGMPMILVKPVPGVSTPACFKAVDSEPITFDEDEYRASMNAIFSEEGDAVTKMIKAKPLLTNDLQKPAVKEVPQINDILDVLNESGAQFAMMSGSGSCSFAIFDSKESRDLALDKVKADPRVKDCSIYSVESV